MLKVKAVKIRVRKRALGGPGRHATWVQDKHTVNDELWLKCKLK